MRPPPVHRLRDLLDTGRLAARTRASRAPVTGSASAPVVMLTTYGERLRTVHTTIEAIARGDLLPSRLILYVDDADLEGLTEPLHLLRKRGLEIRPARSEWGPHKKYFPYCSQDGGRSERPFVTADDDVLYPRSWLADLQRAHERDAETVWAHKTREVRVGHGLVLAPYRDWPESTSRTHASHRRLAIGMGGVIYPARFAEHLATCGQGFMSVAPRADDLWLHAQALRTGRRVGQVHAPPLRMPLRIRSQSTALARENQRGGGNDVVIAALYDLEDRRRIAADR